MMVNTGFLTIFINPDWQETFLLLSMLGIYFSNSKNKLYISKIFFFLAGYANFMYGTSVLIGLIFINFRKTFRIHNKKIININFLRDLFNFPNLENKKKKISLLPIFFGIILYCISRLILTISVNLNPDQIILSGTDLFQRIGIGDDSTQYGGFLSIFKFLIPIHYSDFYLNIKSIFLLDDRPTWETINPILQVFSYFTFSVTGIGYTLFKIIKQLRHENKESLSSIIVFFLILSLTSIILFPESNAVHSLFLARMFSPIMSFGLVSFIYDISKKICGEGKEFFLCICLTWIVIIDCIRFNLTYWL